MSNCALSFTPNKNGTCLNSDLILEISKHFKGNTHEEILQEAQCFTDECLIRKENIPEDVQKRIELVAFKPPTGSFDHNYWLNNTEIDSVMCQLRHEYKGFTHSFIHMIDLKQFGPSNISAFNYPVYSVTDIDFGKEFRHAFNPIPDYKPKLVAEGDAPMSSYGVVFNTDPSNRSGQHWFVIFISTDSRDPNNSSNPWIRIECFNSAGGGSPVLTFNKFWETQAMNIQKETGFKCTFDVITTLQHQSPDTGNCGAYSLFYIYSRLNGAVPSDFDNPKRPIRDYSMQKFRTVCFRIEEGLF